MVDAVFVGNLDKSTTEEELAALFVPFGKPQSVRIIYDLTTGQPKGFGFVKLSDKKAMKLSAKQLNSVELKGKILTVSCAKERK